MGGLGPPPPLNQALKLTRSPAVAETHNGVDFDVQNVLKLTYEHLYFQKIFQGDTPGPR